MTLPASPTRSDLPANPEAAYGQVAEWLELHKAAVGSLTELRDQVLREVAGTDRGGVARAARVAGVTHTQAGRLLADGLVRAVRRAATEAGWARDEYTIETTGQAHPAHVLITLKFDDEPEQDENWDDPPQAHNAINPRWIARMNAAGGLLNELRKHGLAAAHDGLGIDVDSSGPRHALADRQPVEIFWSN